MREKRDIQIELRVWLLVFLFACYFAAVEYAVEYFVDFLDFPALNDPRLHGEEILIYIGIIF